MSEETKHVATPERIPLRTLEDLTCAYERLAARVEGGSVDAKSADALNTVLKGATYLRVKLPLDVAKLIIQSQIKKIEIPSSLKKLLPVQVD